MQLKLYRCMALLNALFIVMQSVSGYTELQSKLPKTDMQEFINYVETYNKKYDSLDDFNRRFSIYKLNKYRVAEMNIRANGTATYGVTQFSDLTQEEFEQKFIDFDDILKDEKMSLKNPYNLRPIGPPIDPKTGLKTHNLPTEIDWTKRNVVTPVSNQGACDSCAVFTAIETIESTWAIKHGRLLGLAVQEDLDCGPRDICTRGSSYNYNYALLIHIGAIPLADKYRYTGMRGNCKLKDIPIGEKPVKISNYWVVDHPTDEYIMTLLYKVGPVGAAINSAAMSFYESGISEPDHTECSNHLDHAVLFVGYGQTREGVKYWKIKNTWGADWGEHGYYYLIRGKDACGINSLVTGPYL